MLTDFNVALGLVHKIGQKKRQKNSALTFLHFNLTRCILLFKLFSFLCRLAKIYSKQFRSIIFAIRLEAFWCYLWRFVSRSVQWTVKIIMLLQSCKAWLEAIQQQSVSETSSSSIRFWWYQWRNEEIHEGVDEWMHRLFNRKSQTTAVC